MALPKARRLAAVPIPNEQHAGSSEVPALQSELHRCQNLQKKVQPQTWASVLGTPLLELPRRFCQGLDLDAFQGKSNLDLDTQMALKARLLHAKGRPTRLPQVQADALKSVRKHSAAQKIVLKVGVGACCWRNERHIYPSWAVGLDFPVLRVVAEGSAASEAFCQGHRHRLHQYLVFWSRTRQISDRHDRSCDRDEHKSYEAPTQQQSNSEQQALH